ncbi:MAG: CHAD domain-containing protein [Pseudonocardiaceae bacterium]
MADTATREVERSYQAPGVSGSPRLYGLPGVHRLEGPEEQTRESFYIDTDDLLLARTGVTVQQVPGRDWILTLPGDGAPLRVPPDAGDTQRIPTAVDQLVRGHARGHELEPVAHTQNTSSRWQLLDESGTPLGEIVADEVSAQTLGASVTVDSWYRLTVTLRKRDDVLLAAIEERLADVGAHRAAPQSTLRRLFGDRLPTPRRPVRKRRKLRPKSSAGDVVLATVADQVDTLKELDPAVRADEPDAVHQMRVAIRRLRSALRNFNRIVDRDATAGLRDELRWLAGVLSAARDQEVVQQRTEELLEATPPENVLGPIAAQLSQQFAREQVEAHARIVAELDTDRYYALLDALDGLLADPPLTPLAAKPARAVLPKLVGRSVKRVDRTVARAGAEQDPQARAAALHQARKAAKRARYAAETVAPALGKPASRSAKGYKKVTQLLGVHQDTVQSRTFLRTLGGRAHVAGQNGFTFGLWYQQEAAGAERVEREFPDLWRRVSRPKRRRWMR